MENDDKHSRQPHEIRHVGRMTAHDKNPSFGEGGALLLHHLEDRPRLSHLRELRHTLRWFNWYSPTTANVSFVQIYPGNGRISCNFTIIPIRAFP